MIGKLIHQMAPSLIQIKKQLLLCVLLFSIPNFTKANPSFQKILNASGLLQIDQIFETHDKNGFVLAGTVADSINPLFNNFLFVRTDTIGNILWSKVYGPASNSGSATFCLTSDGGYLIAGQKDSLGVLGTEDILLTKIDSLGNIRWSMAIGGMASEAISSVTETSDSGFILAGNSYSFGSGNQEIYLIKLDKSGNKIWSRSLGNNIYASVKKIKPTIDGGYALTGLLIPPYDILLVKTDSLGIPEWSRTFGGIMEAWGLDLVQAPDSGFIVLGMTRDGDAGTVFKTDPFGDAEWIKMLSPFNGTIVSSYIQVGTNNDYLIGGYAPVSPSNTDIVLLSINQLGNVLWSISTGTLNSDFGGAFCQVHDSTFAIIGGSTCAGMTSSGGSICAGMAPHFQGVNMCRNDS